MDTIDAGHVVDVADVASDGSDREPLLATYGTAESPVCHIPSSRSEYQSLCHGHNLLQLSRLADVSGCR